MPYKGLAPARQNKTITVPEATFMVPDAGGTPTVRDDFGTDGGGLSNPQDWSMHDSDGRTVQSSSALTGESAMLSRTFMPAYDLMPLVLRNVMGLPVSDTTVDTNTRRLRTWIDPEFGAPAIETITAYHGPEGDPVRLTGGKTQQWSLDVARSSNGGTCGGNIDIEFNRYEDGPGPNYGGTAPFVTPTGQVIPTGQFLEPNHFLLYIAANDTELTAMDWAARPNAYGAQPNNVHMLTKATRSTFQMSDLWKLHYGFNGKRYATDMIPGARSTTMSVTVPRDRSTGSDYRFLKDTELDCQATGFYMVRRWICASYEMRQTLWVGRAEASGFEIDNDIDMATFALQRRRNITTSPSHKIEIWTPV